MLETWSDERLSNYIEFLAMEIQTKEAMLAYASERLEHWRGLLKNRELGQGVVSQYTSHRNHMSTLEGNLKDELEALKALYTIVYGVLDARTAGAQPIKRTGRPRNGTTK